MNILITGGTGFIGTHLTKHFMKKGDNIWILTRSRKSSDNSNLHYIHWDGNVIPGEKLPYIDVVINLAGENILNSWWTSSQKRKILNSRLSSTSACVNFIKESKEKPKRFFSASAVAYYGIYPDKKKIFTEKDSSGKGFLSETARQWEAIAERSEVKPVIMRFGIVIAKDAKSFSLMYKNFKKFAAGYLKPGTQGFPWIHIEDVVQAVEFLIPREETGAFNFVAPELVSNYEFAKYLADFINKTTLFPVPQLIAKTLLGSERAKVLTYGQYVLPERLQEIGYRFSFPRVSDALNAILK